MKDFLLAHESIITNTLLTLWIASIVLTLTVQILLIIRGESKKKQSRTDRN